MLCGRKTRECYGLTQTTATCYNGSDSQKNVGSMIGYCMYICEQFSRKMFTELFDEYLGLTI